MKKKFFKIFSLIIELDVLKLTTEKYFDFEFFIMRQDQMVLIFWLFLVFFATKAPKIINMFNLNFFYILTFAQLI